MIVNHIAYICFANKVDSAKSHCLFLYVVFANHVVFLYVAQNADARRRGYEVAGT